MNEGAAVAEILKGAGSRRRDLIAVLHVIQEKQGCVSAEAAALTARKFHLSESEIYGILTFYRAFSLKPKGRTAIAVCLGTACHVRGGEEILRSLERRLGIRAGETTADGRFSLETVNCLGCCAIGPVVAVDGVFHSRVTPKSAEALVDRSASEAGTS
jgi:NADH:ubiquinone oxidoreductase subunit E